MPVLDAMARGVAVVASRRSAIPEVAGDVALLVDPEDVAELGAALAKLAQDGQLRRDLARKGLPARRNCLGKRRWSGPGVYRELR